MDSSNTPLAGIGSVQEQIFSPAQPRGEDPARQGNYTHEKTHRSADPNLIEANSPMRYNEIGDIGPGKTEVIMSERKIRVLVAKPGLDGHDRGAKVVARALRDAGMEVIYTGLRQTPEMIAEAALQEDVDVIGLSILSGAHMALVPRILELLKANSQEHVKLFVGGIIPEEDVPRLLEMGVVGVYGPGALSETYIADIRKAVLGSAA